MPSGTKSLTHHTTLLGTRMDGDGWDGSSQPRHAAHSSCSEAVSASPAGRTGATPMCKQAPKPQSRHGSRSQCGREVCWGTPCHAGKRHGLPRSCLREEQHVSHRQHPWGYSQMLLGLPGGAQQLPVSPVRGTGRAEPPGCSGLDTTCLEKRNLKSRLRDAGNRLIPCWVPAGHNQEKTAPSDLSCY